MRSSAAASPTNTAAAALALATALLLIAPLSARATTPRNPAVADEARKAGVAPPAMPQFPALLAPSRDAALRTTGPVSLLILLIDYDAPPVPLPTRPAEFYERLAFDPSEKSMKTYYDENSYGALDLGGAVEGWFRSTLPYGYFVNADLTAGTPDDHGFDTTPDAYNPATDPYPRNVWGVVMEAVTLADAAGVDFSDFDGDGDGVVDALCVVHAGNGAEEPVPGSPADFIWSHKSNLADYLASVGRQPLATNDGVRIGDYFMVAASGRLGVYCHEFGHMFGLPDLYRTDPKTREQSSIVGSFDLMDYGAWADGPGLTPSHLGAWCKYELGWIAPTAVSVEAGGAPEIEDAQLFTSVSSSPDGAFYRLLQNPGGVDWTPRRVGRGEYFLIENRVAGDANFDEFLAGSGLAIWHVDETRPNNNSSDANEHLLTLVQADGEDWTAFTGAAARGEPTDLWPGERTDPSFTSASEPSTRLHNGAFSGAEIRDIRQLGEVIEADLSANAVRFGAPYAYPNPLKMQEGAEAEIRFTFEPNARIDPDLEAPPVIVQIFDLSGTLVRTVRAESGPARWDCRNDNGKMIASGTYFYRIQSDRETADGKIVILH